MPSWRREGKCHVGRIKPALEEELGDALEYCQVACVYGHREAHKVRLAIALLPEHPTPRYSHTRTLSVMDNETI